MSVIELDRIARWLRRVANSLDPIPDLILDQPNSDTVAAAEDLLRTLHLHGIRSRLRIRAVTRRKMP